MTTFSRPWRKFLAQYLAPWGKGKWYFCSKSDFWNPPPTLAVAMPTIPRELSDTHALETDVQDEYSCPSPGLPSSDICLSGLCGMSPGTKTHQPQAHDLPTCHWGDKGQPVSLNSFILRRVGWTAKARELLSGWGASCISLCPCA